MSEYAQLRRRSTRMSRNRRPSTSRFGQEKSSTFGLPKLLMFKNADPNVDQKTPLLPRREYQENTSYVDPFTMGDFTEPEMESQKTNWFTRRMKVRFFGNNVKSPDTYEEVELMPITAAMIKCCVIEKGRLINHYAINIRRLPSVMQAVIKSKLSTRKPAIVLSVDQEDLVLIDVHREIALPFVRVSGWLKMSETDKFIYFVDESRVLYDVIDEGEEMLESYDTAGKEEKDRVVSEVSETPSDIADPEIEDGPSKVAISCGTEIAPIVMVDEVPEGFLPCVIGAPQDVVFDPVRDAPSESFWGLGGFFRRVFKK